MNPGASETRHAMPFLDHLEELRKTILWCLGVFAGGLFITFPLAPDILDILRKPLDRTVANPGQFLQSIDVGAAFSISLRIAGWGSLLITAPLMLIFIARFVFPGLKQAEKAAVKRACGFSIVLFILGILVAWETTLPVALQVMMQMHNWMGITAIWTVSSYVRFCLSLMIGFGLAFQLPVVVLALGGLGIVNHKMLAEKRRHVIVGLLILAAVLTPPDVVTQLFMAIPLILLYEVCIIILKVKQRQ